MVYAAHSTGKCSLPSVGCGNSSEGGTIPCDRGGDPGGHFSFLTRSARVSVTRSNHPASLGASPQPPQPTAVEAHQLGIPGRELEFRGHLLEFRLSSGDTWLSSGDTCSVPGTPGSVPGTPYLTPISSGDTLLNSGLEFREFRGHASSGDTLLNSGHQFRGHLT
jgi:hypothetical protein